MPYLSKAYTGEDDALHPQWVFRFVQQARRERHSNRLGRTLCHQICRAVLTGEDPHQEARAGFVAGVSGGVVTSGKGGTVTLQLATAPVNVQWVRIWMTASSNTCDSHGSADKRNCWGMHPRGLSGNNNQEWQISRFAPAHAGSGPDRDLLLLRRSVA